MDRNKGLIQDATGEMISRMLTNQPCEKIDETLYEGQDRELAALANKLAGDLQELSAAALELSEGKFDGMQLARRNYLAAPIKNLQSQLSILAWNLKQLGLGKVVSKIDRPGELYEAYNNVVDRMVELSSGSSGNINDEARLANTSSWRYHQILLALNNIGAMVIETDARGKLVYANRAALTFLAGQTEFTVGSADEAEHSLQAYISYCTQQQNFPLYKELYDDDADRWYKISSDKFYLTGDQLFYVHLLDDITEWKLYEKELSTTAKLDALTEVYNVGAGTKQLRYAVRNSPLGQVHSLVFIDLDNLKRVNDTFGHAAGDEFIKAVADLLLTSVRNTDIVTRYGGDEFFIFFENCNYNDAQKRMDYIYLKLEEMNKAGDGRYKKDFSYGIYAFENMLDIDIDEMIKKADKKMYENKRKKKLKQHNGE